ncbi:thiamine diphosphokinase [Paenibacillus filicis]|uniref:Thiamine diphosphokinase n=1 Tax=Paenibacillus gyeongsangnamensis TaxID=3388067 RepID=A0ABT4QB23_9BACL|nr:thiamine diphosphokinase [Paenibacillus filicis]MCZ8514092.1 thiamine diphosphokinase [Paenibacillus filicis]
MKHRTYTICSGGTLGSWVLPYLKEAGALIGADRGALFLVDHGFVPEISLGDFDSVTLEELERVRSGSRQFISCDPVWKDLTDTEMAFTWALEQGAEEITLCGVLGTRWDHSLANVHLLRRALDAGVQCRIVDEHNELRLMDGRAPLRLTQGRYSHVSLLPLTLSVSGITLHGFRYPLREATLTIGQSLGISNVLTAGEGTIQVRDGLLLVIQSSEEEASG